MCTQTDDLSFPITVQMSKVISSLEVISPRTYSKHFQGKAWVYGTPVAWKASKGGLNTL